MENQTPLFASGENAGGERVRSSPPYHFWKLDAVPGHVYWVDSKGLPVARIAEMELKLALLRRHSPSVCCTTSLPPAAEAA
jgi:hypothetical protein